MKKLLLVAICCLCASAALAETKSFQASLTPDLALQPRDSFIRGVSLNIWGENPQAALAFGVINGSKGQSAGLALGLLGNYSENFNGIQLAWLGNYASGKLTGVQWSAVNYAATLNGVQLGLVNIADTAEQGVQLGLFNVIKQNSHWLNNFPDQIAPAMLFVNWRFR